MVCLLEVKCWQKECLIWGQVFISRVPVALTDVCLTSVTFSNTGLIEHFMTGFGSQDH